MKKVKMDCITLENFFIALTVGFEKELYDQVAFKKKIH